MATAEEILVNRHDDAQAARAAASQASKAQEAIQLAAAQQRYAASIETAVARVEAHGFEGGVLRKRWLGGTATTTVAVWHLNAKRPAYFHGQYYFAPTTREILVQVICGDERRRHHAKDVTNKRLDPARHHAVTENWLMGAYDHPSAQDLTALADALDQLATTE